MTALQLPVRDRLHERHRGRVAGEYARLSAGLDGHVGYGHPVGHGERATPGPSELQRLVVGAVHPDVGDDLDDEVLAGDVSGSGDP